MVSVVYRVQMNFSRCYTNQFRNMSISVIQWFMGWTIILSCYLTYPRWHQSWTIIHWFIPLPKFSKRPYISIEQVDKIVFCRVPTAKCIIMHIIHFGAMTNYVQIKWLSSLTTTSNKLKWIVVCVTFSNPLNNKSTVRWSKTEKNEKILEK